MEIDRIKTDTLPDDGGIVRLFEARDEEALRQTEKAHGALIRRVASRFLDDGRDCEEVVSDVLLAAWNAIPPHRPDSLPAFLVTLARRAAISRLRAENRAKDVPREHLLALEELEEILPDSGSPEGEVIAKELASSISAFLKTQPARRRAVFLYRYYASCSVEEISRRLSLGRSTVEKDLKKTRDALKKQLEREGYEA